ncbi:MAG: UDP-N-acetylmuramoyl-L-alanyl-D-glutamate--2,6-diaminopimelate ligase [Alphaproteobacteria bacterium]|nr:UDP-N-acetylmuramoyl-L-alanyl-D-glutamate--2,6-diaminopimelate ligase [Alphaproteobacteria bacterium]MDE2337071.1 UDP-N-acetylmuramoyl-L-alanyl-D-glutamate--2,6-diaminopimelate ligase [Alphaproteobacteria bacterium]
MQLSELITDLDGVGACDKAKTAKTEITGLTSDSRDVRAGYLFAAFPGTKLDGRKYIDEAVEKGASAVLAPAGTKAAAGNAVMIEAENPRRSFAKMAAAFYGRQVPVLVAVTGTNGKSSTVNFCRQMWQSMEHAAACLGTIGITANYAGGVTMSRPGLLTTPDPVTLHAEIAELEASGVTHLAIEASSQGLDQYRLDGVRVTAAGFTNLTRDHLDYHGTMEKYLAAKLRLFSDVLTGGGVAVINSDTPYSGDFRAACEKRGLRVIGYGWKAKDIRLVQQRPLSDGQFVELMVFGERYELELPLVGDFQAANALCALGLVLAEDPDNRLLHMQGVYALERLQSVRGRLELAAKHPNGATIYVDYAHTPDGLETMLKALRPHTHKNLHVVFGCGGDRDRGKRPMMGEIAVRLADRVIVTDDNPRTEDATAIRKEIMTAAPKATEIGGRREAIRAAIRGLGPEDVLVIAGKGHEQGQIVGKDILPFDDVSEARSAVLEVSK